MYFSEPCALPLEEDYLAELESNSILVSLTSKQFELQSTKQTPGPVMFEQIMLGTPLKIHILPLMPTLVTKY